MVLRTDQQIDEADYVILALGKGISDEDRVRFDGKKVVELPVSEALKHIDSLFDDIDNKAVVLHASKVKLGNEQKAVKEGVMSYLMAGVSAALPFVIGGWWVISCTRKHDGAVWYAKCCPCKGSHTILSLGINFNW